MSANKKLLEVFEQVMFILGNLIFCSYTIRGKLEKKNHKLSVAKHANPFLYMSIASFVLPSLHPETHIKIQPAVMILNMYDMVEYKIKYNSALDSTFGKMSESG